MKTQSSVVIRRVRAEHEHGLKSARKLNDPWRRCQALAWVARFAPEDAVRSVVDEAFKVFKEDDDLYKSVASTAWPIRALIERGQHSYAAGRLRSVMKRAERIENPVSRMDALMLLFQSAFPLGGRELGNICGLLVKSCKAARSWKADCALRDAALIMGETDPIVARRIIESMPDGKPKRQAERRMASHQWSQPRIFFWEKPRADRP